MTLSKKEKEFLSCLGVEKGNIKTTKGVLNGLNLSERGARDMINRLLIKYGLAVGGLRNRSVNGVFIAETQEEIMEILTPLINQVNEEQKRITALANSDPEKSRELVKKLLEGA